MRTFLLMAAGLLATLAPGAAMAQHHGGGHSSGHGGYGNYGGGYEGHRGYNEHGRVVVVSPHGYSHAQPYYGNGYYSDYPRYQTHHQVRERHYDRHSRPRHIRRHH